MKRPAFIAWFAVLCAALIALDQWTKYLAETLLAGKGTIKLAGDLAILVFAQNTGAFLSLGAGLPEPARIAFLIVIPSAILLAAIALFCVKGKTDARSLAVLCLLASGGFGNIIDRIFKVKVTDFLNFGIGRLRTGVMNLADLYILALLILLIVGMMAEREKGHDMPVGKPGAGQNPDGGMGK